MAEEAEGSFIGSPFLWWEKSQQRRCLLPPHGRGDMGKVKLFLLSTSMCPHLCFLAPTMSRNVSSRNLDFHKGCLIHEWLSKAVFSKGSGLWPRGAGAGSYITRGSTARYKVCLPIAQCRGGQDSSRVRSMVLGPAAPIKALLSTEWCWIFVVEVGTKMRCVLCHHDAYVTVSIGFSLGDVHTGTFFLHNKPWFPKFQTPRRKAGIYYKSHCLPKQSR